MPNLYLRLLQKKQLIEQKKREKQARLKDEAAARAKAEEATMRANGIIE